MTFPAVKHGTLLADSERKIQAFKTKCMRKLLRISYLEHKTNNWVRSKINFFVGPQKPLLATIKRWKLARRRTNLESAGTYLIKSCPLLKISVCPLKVYLPD